MRLAWTRRSINELRAIRAYIAFDNVDAATRWIGRLRSGARSAVSFPQAGRVVPEFDRHDIREVLIANYRLVYSVTADEVRVLTVFEGSRLLQLDVVNLDGET